MEPLAWQDSGPRPNPFEAVVGDLTMYEVHFAASAATSRAEIGVQLHEVVMKALSYAEANNAAWVERLCFQWDGVYATLTVVYTDHDMQRDATHVVQCQFVNVDQRLSRLFKKHLGKHQEAQKAESKFILARLRDLCASLERFALPPHIGLYFCDVSNGYENLSAVCLVAPRA